MRMNPHLGIDGLNAIKVALIWANVILILIQFMVFATLLILILIKFVTFELTLILILI